MGAEPEVIDETEDYGDRPDMDGTEFTETPDELVEVES